MRSVQTVAAQVPFTRVKEVCVIVTRPINTGQPEQSLPWHYLVVGANISGQKQLRFLGGEVIKKEDTIQTARRAVKMSTGISVLVEDMVEIGKIDDTMYYHFKDTNPAKTIDGWRKQDPTSVAPEYTWSDQDPYQLPDNRMWRRRDLQAIQILTQPQAQLAKVTSTPTHYLPRRVTSIGGINTKRTCRSLFDSGATHSVMDIKTAELFKMQIDSKRGPKQLIVADGKTTPVVGMTPMLQVVIDGIVTEIEFIVADLAVGAAGQDDVILGLDWWRKYHFRFIYSRGEISGGEIDVPKPAGAEKETQTFPMWIQGQGAAIEELKRMAGSTTRIKRISAKAMNRKTYSKLMTVFVATATEPQTPPPTDPSPTTDVSGEATTDPLPTTDVSGEATTQAPPAMEEQMDQRVQDLIDQKEFKHIFNMPDDHFPTNRDVVHKIELIREIPTDRRVPRMSQAEIEECRRQVSELLQKGWIEPSRSPIGAPIVFARKSDGSLRMCLDYRKLNSATRPDAVPLPRLENLLATVADARVFSSCDAKSWYNQILMHEPDIWKTAFKSPLGLFQWRVMPFGLTGSGGTANTMMEHVLRGLIHRPHSGVVVFVDDIAVYSRNEEEHLQVLEEVFERFKKHGLFLNGKKCKFMQKEIKFLGHIISDRGLHVDPDKVSAIKDMPPPTTTKEVRRFIGMASYYRRFVPRFADICAPLHHLVNTKWAQSTHPNGWTVECQQAFDTLKDNLTRAPILKLVNLDQPLVLRTDASQLAMGATLYNDIDGVLHPIEYRSKKLSSAQSRKAPHEQEFLAVLYGLAEFRCYLMGRPFTLETDNSAVSWIKKSKELCSQHSRWVDIFEEYQCTIRHRAGLRMHVEDPLSRIDWPADDPVHGNTTPFDPEVAFSRKVETFLHDDAYQQLLITAGVVHEVAISPAQSAARVTIATALKGESATARMHTSAQQGNPSEERESTTTKAINSIMNMKFNDPTMREWPSRYECDPDLAHHFNNGNGRPEAKPAFIVKDGIMFIDDGQNAPRLCVPQGEARQKYMQELHATPFSGHLGKDKTLANVVRRLYWPGMFADVTQFQQSCHICQEAKIDRRVKAGAYTPLQVPLQPFDCLGIDFVGPFPKTQQGHDYICTVICHLTGYTHLIPCKKDDSAAEVARRFFREIIRLRGCPMKIVSDRDPKFTSKFWTDLCYRLGTKMAMSTAYHPQTDGRTERANDFMTEILRTATNINNTRAWEEALDMVEFAINNSPAKSTGITPFFAVYGFHPRVPFDVMLQDIAPAEVPTVYERVELLKAIHIICADQIRRHRHQQTLYGNRKRRDETYQVGEQVLLATKNIKLTVPKDSTKLVSPFIGPFHVKAVKSNAITLQLPPAMRMHPTVNIASIRKYHQRATPQKSRHPAPIAHDNAPAYEIDQVLAERINGSRREFLIMWKGFGDDEASWEPATNFKNKNPAVIALHRNRFPLHPHPIDGTDLGDAENLDVSPPLEFVEDANVRDVSPSLGPIDDGSYPAVRRSARHQGRIVQGRGAKI